MRSEQQASLQALLNKIPDELHVDLDEAALRLNSESSIVRRVEALLANHRHKDRLCEELFGLGPLNELLADETVSEIIINGADHILFERNGEFHTYDDVFLSSFTLAQFAQRVCAEAGTRLDLGQPFCDATWRGFRVHLSQAPVSDKSHCICIRRHPKYSWKLSDLAERNWASPSEIEVLRHLLSSRQNMLVVGPTGSGKTSVLSAMLSELPDSERIVILEDTSEIHSPNPASTKLLTRSDSQTTMRDYDLTDLVKQSLRMRPTRLVVGEVRGGEAKDLLLALSTGHAGSLGTLHAFSARQALLRLEMLIQMGAPNWSLETIRQLIFSALQILVVVIQEGGKRRLEGLYRISSLEKIGFLLERISSDDQALKLAGQ